MYINQKKKLNEKRKYPIKIEKKDKFWMYQTIHTWKKYGKFETL